MRLSIKMQDIYDAAKAIEGIACHTPLLQSAALSKSTGTKIYLKLECFQPTRVFKVRGATNKIKKLPPEAVIVTASSGNHGFAISYVSKLLGRKAIVCVPKTANPDKVNAIKQYGAEVVAVGTSYEDAYEEALRIVDKVHGQLAHPFEDPLVIAGQGTIALEMLAAQPSLDTLFVPIGGGGLISGIAFAAKNLKKSIKIIGVQSSNAPSTAEAFRAGHPVPVRISPTIADGIVAKRASEITLEIIRKYVDDIVLVSDSQIEETLLTLLRNDHVLSEPSGAASVAALKYAYKAKPNEELAAVVSGGNVAVDYLAKLLATN
ncbi:MAG TPA: threonine/serine dehydratase [Candidatus Bathyarchaeia archaeon]|nr:threonine/serine dehydratase [Candidatus Bathyarchaeia archaeon]